MQGSNGSPRDLESPWGAHAQALHNLMKLAGPAAFQSPGGLALLRGQRGHMVSHPGDFDALLTLASLLYAFFRGSRVSWKVNNG